MTAQTTTPAATPRPGTAPRAVLPRRLGWWYVAEHELRRVPSFWLTWVATAIGSPLLYLLAFGVGLATLIGGGSGDIDGVPYACYVIPAFMCAAAVGTAAEEYMFGILMGFMWNKVFEAMYAGPVTPRQIVLGHFVYTTIRVAATSAIYLAIAMAFGAIQPGWGFAVLPVAILTGLAFGLPIGAYASSITEDRGQFNIVNRVIILPLTLFSGTVFPLDRMPAVLQWIGWLSPLWHGTQLSRDLSYGQQEPAWLIVLHVAYLLAICAVAAVLIVRITEKRLRK
jgi:lipooligosaccharide transport system permease protein